MTERQIQRPIEAFAQLGKASKDTEKLIMSFGEICVKIIDHEMIIRLSMCKEGGDDKIVKLIKNFGIFSLIPLKK